MWFANPSSYGLPPPTPCRSPGASPHPAFQSPCFSRSRVRLGRDTRHLIVRFLPIYAVLVLDLVAIPWIHCEISFRHRRDRRGPPRSWSRRGFRAEFSACGERIIIVADSIEVWRMYKKIAVVPIRGAAAISWVVPSQPSATHRLTCFCGSVDRL